MGGAAQIYLNGELLGGNLRNGRISLAEAQPYRFYCRFAAGENELKVVTTLQESSLPPISGYVKVGRRVAVTPFVHLHWGLARVFVRSAAPAQAELDAVLR